MQVLKGHLTAAERRHIRQILNSAAFEGGTKLKRYKIEPTTSTLIEVTVWSRYTDMIGDSCKWHKDYATVRLTREAA